MDRNKLIDYFTLQYKERGFFTDKEIEKILAEKSTEELDRIYNIEQLREENKNKIYKKSFKAYQIEFSNEDSKEIARYSINRGMFKVYENEISYNLRADHTLFYVPDVFVQELEKHFNIKRLDCINILGRDQLSNFKIGDKVKITFNNWYGGTVEQGTIHSIKDDEIMIRKYRSRSKGFTFKVGEECNIVKIKAFNKVS